MLVDRNTYLTVCQKKSSDKRQLEVKIYKRAIDEYGGFFLNNLNDQESYTKDYISDSIQEYDNFDSISTLSYTRGLSRFYVLNHDVIDEISQESLNANKVDSYSIMTDLN